MKNQEQIDKLKKAIASPATPENFKESMRKKLAELEATESPVKKEKPVKEESLEQKYKRGVREAKNNYRYPVGGRSKEEVIKKKKKGKPKVSSSPKFTAKRDGDDAEPGCDELLKRFNDRREAAKKSQRKAKTIPVFTKISSDVVNAVEKAIKNVPIVLIDKKEINRFESLKNAAQNFLKEFRFVLGDHYDSKDSEKEIKELEDLISKLENKYLKK